MASRSSLVDNAATQRIRLLVPTQDNSTPVGASVAFTPTGAELLEARRRGFVI
jgi:hypothetical protein